MSENTGVPTEDGWNEADGAASDNFGADGLDSLTPRAPAAPGGGRKAAQKVQAKIDKVAGGLSQGVSKAADRGVSAFEGAAGQARRVADAVEPFVREKPFMSSGVALATGLLLGLLLGGRGPKVIYVKTRPG